MRLLDRLAGWARPSRAAATGPGAVPELCWRREALLAFLQDHLPSRPAILDTAPGDFTLALLGLEPRELVGVDPDPRLWGRLRAACEREGICSRPLQVHLDAPRWVLPRLTATVRERSGRFDLVRLGQCEAWPSACLELAHAGLLLRRGGFLIVDGLALRPGAHRCAEPPGYRLHLEYGSGLVFEKISHCASLHEWVRPAAFAAGSPRALLPV